jgi:tetrapyrrole methylase family protein/MazG family protein
MRKKIVKRKRSKRERSKRSKSHVAPKVGPPFQKLVDVMARLRAPNGCPWDREQTHATLRTYLIEEAYEVLDALDSTDDAKFAEELGDLLLQVLFHAQIAHEENRFDISDVIREIYEKMIRRHPHVFGTTSAKTAAEVLRNWEQIKAQERQSESTLSGRSDYRTQRAFSRKPSGSSDTGVPDPKNDSDAAPSYLDGVPRTLPALLEALQLTRKAARVGFDWHNIEGIFDKLTEETGELQLALAAPSGKAGSGARVESEVGDILFVAVNLARFLDIDPEIALKKTSRKFSRRFREMERIAREQGTTLAQIPRADMESLWDRVKLDEMTAKDGRTN